MSSLEESDLAQDATIETELKRLRPKAPPEDLVQRVLAVGHSRFREVRNSAEMRCDRATATLSWSWLKGWLLPAGSVAALVIAAAILVRLPSAKPTGTSAMAAATPATAVLADDVLIERNLTASYDAIARLPDGVPVRLFCEEWEDRVRFRDSTSGVVIERSIPRLEVVPVSFETY
jgi:hypothetical protein